MHMRICERSVVGAAIYSVSVGLFVEAFVEYVLYRVKVRRKSQLSPNEEAQVTLTLKSR